MSVLKKVFFSLFLSLTGILVFSISAFAADVEFTLSNYPTNNLVNSNKKQSYSVVWLGADDNYYYGEFIFDRNRDSYYFGSSFFVSPYVVKNVANSNGVTYDDYFLLPCFYGTGLSSGGSTFNMEFKGYVFRAPGAAVSDSGQYYVSPSPTKTTPFTFGNLFFGVNVTENNYNISCRLKDGYSFYVIDYPEYPITGQSSIIPHIPSGYQVVVDSEYRNYVNDSWDGSQAACSIPDDIYINGVLVYHPSGGGGNIASSIIGSGIGSMTPEYDENGNITNIITNNTYEFDITPFTESDGNQPDSWDNSAIDDYNSSNDDVQDSISDFKGQFAFSDVFGEDFDLTSFRGAMTFWKDRFDEVIDFNPVFPVLITTSLTLGLVAVILGRKLGVG